MEVARDVLLTARLDDQARFTQVWGGKWDRNDEKESN